MKIGQALRQERLALGLTQTQMCNGILSRSFYAKVEGDKTGISAASLFKILIAHQIDVSNFYELIKDTYASSKERLSEQLQNKMNVTVNTKNLKKMDKYKLQILATDDEILKLRAIVTVAYFKGQLNEIDTGVKKELKKKFDEGKDWINRPESLRLFANTMPLWSQEELDFFINRLLTSIQDEKISELMQERYLRILGNYLVICYQRKIKNNLIKKIINYAINTTSERHLMIYRVHTLYMRALLEGNKTKANKIKNDMKDYGYDTANWPQ